MMMNCNDKTLPTSVSLTLINYAYVSNTTVD